MHGLHSGLYALRISFGYASAGCPSAAPAVLLPLVLRLLRLLRLRLAAAPLLRLVLRLLRLLRLLLSVEHGASCGRDQRGTI